MNGSGVKLAVAGPRLLQQVQTVTPKLQPNSKPYSACPPSLTQSSMPGSRAERQAEGAVGVLAPA